eukprot:931152-Prymnesium_polylepis.1
MARLALHPCLLAQHAMLIHLARRALVRRTQLLAQVLYVRLGLHRCERHRRLLVRRQLRRRQGGRRSR